MDTARLRAQGNLRLASPGLNFMYYTMARMLFQINMFIGCPTFLQNRLCRLMKEKNYAFLFLSDLLLLTLTSDVKNETIALRRANKLKLPDCIIAATAIVLNAKLLTSDSELLRLEWPGYDVNNFSI